MEAADEVPDAPLDADDVAREALPSDDEEGPADPDEEEDAMPPGDNIVLDGDGDGDVVMNEAEAGATAGAATAEVPAAPPALPEQLNDLKVPELKEQLIWRGVKPTGNKPDLISLLQKSVDAADALLKPEDESFAAVRAFYGAQARAAPAGAPKERWERIDASKIDRPVCMLPAALSFSNAPLSSALTNPSSSLACNRHGHGKVRAQPVAQVHREHTPVRVR